MTRRILPVLLVSLLPALTSGETWVKHLLTDSFDNARGVIAADFDNDGDLDVAGCSRYNNRVGWWENLGSSFQEHLIDTTFGGGWSVHAGDIDGDGLLDILSAGIVAHEIAWWQNPGPGGSDDDWVRHTVIPLNLSKGVYAVDIDEDGDTDVLGAASGSDVFTLSTNQGDGSFTHQVLSETDGARSVHASDLNGDGLLDVIGSSGAANRIGWFAQADTGWVGDLVITEWEASRAAIGVDMDNDGDNDIATCARYEDTIAWLENDGAGQGWTMHIVDDAIPWPRSLDPVDMDFDGDIDIVAHSNDSGLINWYENLGDDQWLEHVIATNFAGAMQVDAADMDGDGDYDVLCAGANADQIALWERAPDDPVTVAATPWEDPYLVPEEGDTVHFDVAVNSLLSFDSSADLWVQVTYPGGGHEILDNHPVAVPGAGALEELDHQWVVDSELEPGFYDVAVKVGVFPDGVVSEESFVVRKLTTWVKEPSDPATTHYELLAGWPNPFNARTRVSVNLPAPGPLQVQVYDLQGRQVARLADGPFPAGRHGFAFHAHGLPSGVYFVRASVPSRLDAVQRITLLK